MKSPVLLIAFNRPDNTQKVFDVIKEAKPPILFFAVDGPRANKVDEDLKCKEVREIIKQVDWNCEVHTLFRDENLGCKRAVSSAISWFFEHIDQGIILEDDCLAAQSFFKFCDEMLEKYKDDERVMMVSGNNFQQGQKVGTADYYFSKIFCIWGWATWKRAWEKYDGELLTYPEFKKNKKFKEVFKNENIQWYWTKTIDRVKNKSIDTWDYQWFYTIWSNNALSIVPNINLVQNIGFDGTGTHTAFNNDLYSIPASNFDSKIVDPLFIIPSAEVDEKAFKNFYRVNLSKTKIILRKIFDKKFRETIF